MAEPPATAGRPPDEPRDAAGGDPDDPLWLPPKPPRDRALLASGLVLALLIVIAAGFTLVGPNGLWRAQDENVVTIGTTEASADFWPILQRLAAKDGIEIRTIAFSDFTQPNPALAQGQTDLNLFQHLIFLANYNVSSNQTLTPIGSTVVVPLGLYSQQYTSVEQIPTDAQIAIPNDPTNQARALLVLQKAGLITLRGGGSPLSTPADVETASSRVRVVPVAAQQAVASLPSVAGAVINNGFAMDAGLDPSKALFADDPESPEAAPYINVFVARAADKDNPTYLKIVQLYHTAEVTDAVVKASRGTAVIVSRPAAELQKLLSTLEAEVRAKGGS